MRFLIFTMLLLVPAITEAKRPPPPKTQCVKEPPPQFIKMVCDLAGQNEDQVALVCTRASIVESNKSLVDMMNWQNETWKNCGPKGKDE